VNRADILARYREMHASMQDEKEEGTQ